MNYIGDFAEDSTVYVVLTTNDGNGGAVAPSSAFEEADFRIYKNGSATQKTSTNGITISSPFDSVTGLHILSIDTSNDTGDTGFWTTGADYWVVAVPDETVDSQTVVAVIASFSIENRLRVKASDEVSANVTKISGDSTAADNAEAFFDGTGYAGTNNVIPTVTSVTNRVTANTDQIAGASVSTSTAQIGVNVVNAGGTAWGSGAITAAAIASNAITSAKIATDAIGSAQLASTAITEIQSGLATTANVAAVETDTQDIQSRLPAALVSGRMDSSVGAMEPNTITSSVIATGAITASSIQTNAITDDKIAASAITEIQSGLATTTQLTTVEGKIDAIDGVTDKLDTTLELDGAVYRFTTNALEQAPSGGGGGGSSIMVTPVVSQTPVRVIGQNISTFIGDLSTITVGVFSGSDPVDLSGFGDLEVCVQARSGVDLDFVPMADLTISGDDNNYVSWDPAGPSVADVVRGKWSLRKTSNKQVIAYGAWIVEDAALEDTGS